MKRKFGFLAVVTAGMAVLAPLCAAGRTISANYTLTQDEDWTSDGTVQIENAATIDLSGRTTPLPCQSLIGTNCVANAKNITFADNATIRVA